MWIPRAESTQIPLWHGEQKLAIWTEYASVDTPADKQVVRGCEIQYEGGGIEQQPDEQVVAYHRRLRVVY